MTELETLEGDNRPPSYIEDGRLILRASAFGTTCLYELVAPAQGYEPGNLPANMIRAFGEGHKAEPIIVQQLVDEYHVVFHSQQGEGELELPDDVAIRFHSDGVIFIGSTFWNMVGRRGNISYKAKDELPPRHVVLEIKNLSDVLWQKFVRHGMAAVIDEYEWQLSVMMHVTGLPGLWCGRNKGFPPDQVTGQKPYCADEGKLYFQVVQEPPIPLSEIVSKAARVRELVYGEDVTDTGQGCGDPTHWPCRYLHLRPEPERSTEGVMDSGFDEERFNNLARDFVLLKGQKDEVDAKYERTRDELIALSGLAPGDKGELRTDEWIVPIYTGTNTSSLRWDEMPEEVKTLIQSYRKNKKYLYIQKARRNDGTN